MNKKLFFLACFLFSVPAFAQYPGGLRDSLKIWLKANQGITPTTTNTVTVWTELSGAGVTGNFAPSSINSVVQQPATFVPAGINFNPHVAFDRTKPTGFVSLNETVGNRLFDGTNNTVFQVLFHPYVANYTGVYLKWQTSNTAPRFGYEINNNGIAGQDQTFRWDFNGGLRSTTTITNQYLIAETYSNTTQKAVVLNGLVNNTATMAGPVDNTCTGRVGLGNEPTVGSIVCPGFAQSLDSYPTTMNYAEVVWFKRTLTAAERNKVESYLAVKYGFTLDQGTVAANNYTSANGSVIWNRALNLPFINNITGIGRDDSSVLVQRQSKSINAPVGMVTIYNGSYTGATAPALNTANTNNFTADNSFLLYGDNALALTNTRCFSTAGTGFLRMNRIWKAQKTGTVGTVTLAINAADVPTNTRHLLVSTDSAFTPANTTIYRLDVAAGILSKPVIFAQANSYFTYASDTLIAHPSSNSPVCQGATLLLNSNITGLSSYNWTGPNGYSSVVQNPVINPVTTANAGVYTLNASAGSCVLQPASITVVVNPIPAPPTVSTPLIYCEGSVAPALTAVGTNIKWYSQPVGGAGTTIAPVPSTIYEDTLVYWVTQSNNAGCESIRSRQEVQIRYRPNGIILGAQSSICQGDVDTFTYFGNARNTAVFDFKNPAGTTKISGSNAGPYIVRFDSAGTYRVRMQINNNGCVSDEMFYTVTVRPSPVIRFSNKPDACVDEVVNVALFYTTSNVTNYNYNFANGQIVYGTATGGPYGVKWNTPGTKVIRLDATTIGCPARTTYDTITIHPYPDARIRTVSKTSICTGDSVLFTASEQDSNTRFYWTPDYYFSSGNIFSAWGVVKKDGYVKLDVESRWGCRSSDSVRIEAAPCCQLFLPNVFTPNNDGKNDVFKIVTTGHHNISNFRIVNRWGQTVFETKDETRGWNGIFNGKEQDMGTYYYYIRYQCSTNEYFEQKGELLLLR